MPIHPLIPPVHIPEVNILEYIFGDPKDVTDKPLWIDSQDPSKSLSTRQALGWIKRLGLGLQRLGLKRGDVVMMCSTNHIFVPVLYLGVVGATCAFTGANPAYTPKGKRNNRNQIAQVITQISNSLKKTTAEIAHQISNAQAKIILAHPSKLNDVLAAAAETNFPTSHIYSFSADVSGATASTTPSNGVCDWTALLAPATDPAAQSWSWPALSRPGEAKTTLATINYSSGTTGLPKGVCVSHYNLAANVQQILGMRYPGGGGAAPASAASDRWVAFLPLYHAYGQMYTILMAARRHVTVHVMSVFTFEAYLQLIERHRVNVLQVVPPIIVMLAKRPEVGRYDISSVQEISCGAAPLKRDLQNEVSRRLGVNIVQGWGMTELTCASTSMPSGHRDDTGSCGRLNPNCEAKFVGEDGTEVVEGEPGELFVRGPNVMMGYWRNEKATKETLDPEGWLRTGDVAVYKDGLIWIVDRKKVCFYNPWTKDLFSRSSWNMVIDKKKSQELIKVNGLQVAPAELESILLDNEHIADAAVVGITL